MVFEYYENLQTRPIFMNGLKLFPGDVYQKDDEGVKVFRDGKQIYPVVEEVEEVVEEKVEEPKVGFSFGLGTASEYEEPKEDEVILDNMTKVELENYAKEVYGVDLDRRRNKRSMIAKIKSLQEVS